MDIKKQRTDYLSWDEYFMGIAKLSALRSKDPSTQVGACIVSDDNRILSIGYNGARMDFMMIAFLGIEKVLRLKLNTYTFVMQNLMQY